MVKMSWKVTSCTPLEQNYNGSHLVCDDSGTLFSLNSLRNGIIQFGRSTVTNKYYQREFVLSTMKTYQIVGFCLDSQTKFMFVSDTANSIRRIAYNGAVETLLQGKPNTQPTSSTLVTINRPTLITSLDGTLYVVDIRNNHQSIKSISPNFKVETIINRVGPIIKKISAILADQLVILTKDGFQIHDLRSKHITKIKEPSLIKHLPEQHIAIDFAGRFVLAGTTFWVKHASLNGTQSTEGVVAGSTCPFPLDDVCKECKPGCVLHQENGVAYSIQLQLHGHYLVQWNDQYHIINVYKPTKTHSIGSFSDLELAKTEFIRV